MRIRPIRTLVLGLSTLGLASCSLAKKAELAAYTEAILCLQDLNVVAAIMPEPSLKKGTRGLIGSFMILPGTKAPNQNRKDFFTLKKDPTPSIMQTLKKLCKFVDPRTNGVRVPLLDKKTIKKEEQKIYQNAPDSTQEFVDTLKVIENAPDSTKDFSDALTVIQKASPKKKKAPSSTVLT
jgi:hypothetical protein